MRKPGIWRSALVVVFLVVAALPAAAEEFIRTYHSDITVGAQGDLTVAETITVNAEGDRIKRGIFRDFPLTMTNAEGRTVRVGFDMVSLTRDGRPEEWHTESITGGIRIYAGSKDVMLRDGPHTYVLTYRTDRQIRFFADHDELYWNVTGNGWQFRIASVSARVTLPNGAQVLRTAAFTGPLGSTASDARFQQNGNTAVFATTRPLAEAEGLTVAVEIPKGVIAPPSSSQVSAWWWRDNAGTIIAVVGLVLVLAYYGVFWTRVGRDPPRGVVVPRWDAPDGLSPALVNYIDNKGFSGSGWTAFSASALDLAVKGYVLLEDLKNSITITRTDKKSDKPLPVGQSNVLRTVDAAGGRFVINESNGAKVEAAGKTFRTAIETEHRGRYYHANRGYVIGGVVLSALALFCVVAFGNLEPDMIAVLVIPVFLAVFFGIMAAGFGQNLRRGSSVLSKIISILVLGVIALIAIAIISALLIGMVTEMTGNEHWPLLVSVGGIVLANVIFFFLMAAPTPLGRKLMDGIEGLRIYLTLAEKDRMNMAGAPTMSPRHFETLLPYAVALGVEKPWSKTFEAWLASSATDSYEPGWYAGMNSSGFGERIGGFSSSMASTIASTIPTPQTSSSSSGFSGGSSGGGGGGGGGGGW